MNWLVVFLMLLAVYALIGLAHFMAWLDRKGCPSWLLTFIPAMTAALLLGYMAAHPFSSLRVMP